MMSDSVVFKKPKRFFKRRWVLIVAAIAVNIVFVVVLVGALTLLGKGPLSQDKVILVERGSGVRRIAEKLYSEQVIYSRPLFTAGVLLAGHRSELKAGEYAFNTGQSMVSVISELVRGQILIRQLIIPEGLTVQRVIKMLNDAPSLQGPPITDYPPEGSLSPETYYYSWGDERSLILNRMKSGQSNLIKSLWENHDKSLPLLDEKQAITLASIVEKETAKPEERARIAGVFYNRLRLGMKLQSDPTVIYAMTNGWGLLDRPLWRSDWKNPSPFNTYAVDGLPPGPIANPGRAALEAVFHPEKNDYLYFVADGTGGHAFAATLDEHNRNVINWKKTKD